MSIPNRETSGEGGGGGPHWLGSAALRLASIWDANYCGVQCVTISRQLLSTSFLFFSLLSSFVFISPPTFLWLTRFVSCSCLVIFFVTSDLSIARTTKRASSRCRIKGWSSTQLVSADASSSHAVLPFPSPLSSSFLLPLLSLGVKARMTSSCASPTAASWSSTGFSSV